MGKLRILHCLETVGSGGVEQRRLTLARKLDATRYEQALVCTKAIGGLPSQYAEAACPIHEVGVFRGIHDRAPYRRALNIVRQYRPHIIHGAVYEGVALAAVAGRLGRVPIIIGEETSDPANRRWTGHVLYRLLCGMTHHMIGVSPAVRDYLVNEIHLQASKVTLINNGVAEAPPANAEQIQAIRETFGLTPGNFVIGTVGRLLDSHKRVSDLIRALQILHISFPGARLLIVGSGPDEQMLRQLATELGVAQCVHFAGYQPNPQAYYSVMNVFALASASEAFGLVLVEAMYASLAVVATRVGGIPAVVSEGETGLLVEPGQPQALAEALLTLQRSNGLRDEMGQKGRARALAKFGAERYVHDVDRLYQDLASKRVAP
jgi:glycosyltransferase involved in cell wall biosynthesis